MPELAQRSNHQHRFDEVAARIAARAQIRPGPGKPMLVDAETPCTSPDRDVFAEIAPPASNAGPDGLRPKLFELLFEYSDEARFCSSPPQHESVVLHEGSTLLFATWRESFGLDYHQKLQPAAKATSDASEREPDYLAYAMARRAGPSTIERAAPSSKAHHSDPRLKLPELSFRVAIEARFETQPHGDRARDVLAEIVPPTGHAGPDGPRPKLFEYPSEASFGSPRPQRESVVLYGGSTLLLAAWRESFCFDWQQKLQRAARAAFVTEQWPGQAADAS